MSRNMFPALAAMGVALLLFVALGCRFLEKSPAPSPSAATSSQAPARPPQSATKLLFRVKVSDVGLQNSSLVQGKGPADFVEVTLSGELYDPPRRFQSVKREQAKWDTPLDAAASDFSAFKADEDAWILENFVSQERDQVREFLSNARMREQNRKSFEGAEYREVTGQAQHQGYVLVFARESGETRSSPLTFQQTAGGWKRTNALSGDEVFDIVFTALLRGGEVSVTNESR